jgi:hypothetical protein
MDMQSSSWLPGKEDKLMDEGQIKSMLERYGIALSTGDIPGIAYCWEVPALVLSDEGAIAVSAIEGVEEFFRQAVGWYQSQGLTLTKPELERVDKLSEKLASVDVCWPGFDADGNEKYSERSHYIISLGKDEQVRIRVALTRNT